jgi:hypothetical protein
VYPYLRDSGCSCPSAYCYDACAVVPLCLLYYDAAVALTRLSTGSHLEECLLLHFAVYCTAVLLYCCASHQVVK